MPSAKEYLPGEHAKVQAQADRRATGKPIVGSTVVAIYDKALDYIAGGGERAGHPRVLLEVAAEPPPAERDEPRPRRRAGG